MSDSIATDEYVINAYAGLIAEQTSGIRGAVPEQSDFSLASEVFDLIERRVME